MEYVHSFNWIPLPSARVLMDLISAFLGFFQTRLTELEFEKKSVALLMYHCFSLYFVYFVNPVGKFNKTRKGNLSPISMIVRLIVCIFYGSP